jgi:hypothetical protein
MNQNFKAVLLTVLTLSIFVIAIIELTGISKTAMFNKFGHQEAAPAAGPIAMPVPEKSAREKQANAMPKTKMVFDTMVHNFGTVKEGEVVKYAFKFKNTGDNPLMISKTDVSCGCTTPSFPKEPIAPGGTGEIMVQFNTSGKEGMQKKNILVHSNAEVEAVSISIEANVK